MVVMSAPSSTLLVLATACSAYMLINRPHSCRFYLSNPITGESLALPDIYSYPHTCGFGLSPVSNVYKVVFLRTCVRDVVDIMVLTVGSSVWRNIGKYRFSSWNGEDGIYLNGILHWVGMSGLRWVIWAFDVESELSQYLPLPLSFHDTSLFISSDLRLVVMRASLCLIVLKGENVSVWVMKDYGVKGSWTKEFAIVKAFEEYVIPPVLKFTEGQVLLVHGHQLKAYTPGKMGFSKVEVDGLPERVAKGWVHIPSFASLKDIIRS